jgi:esterase
MTGTEPAEFASLADASDELGLDRAAIRRAVLVDVTPGSPQAAAAMSTEQRGAVELIRGPGRFASREEMIEAAVQASPRRPPSAVRRGVIQNTRQLPDGTFTWRYDRPDPGIALSGSELWEDVTRLTMPTMLVTGGESAFVTADDLAELARRLPSIRVEPSPAQATPTRATSPAPSPP